MEMTLECQKREPGSKPNALRRSGLIPAVLYGHNGTESIELTIKAKDAETLLKKATTNNTLIKLNVADQSWNGQTILREVQTHPWKNKLIYHLSFFSVASQSSLEVTVPLNFVGEPAGVKQGGALDTVFTELQVQCAPGAIPDAIDVDVTHLNVGDMLHVDDLVLPPGVTVIQQGERVIASVLATRGSGAAGETEETAE